MPNQKHITLFEHQALRIGQKVNGMEFTENHRKALEAHYGSGKKYFKLIHRGVQFNEYVGVLQVGNVLIEILPKADKNNVVEKWRKILIDMLRIVGAFDIQAPSSSTLNIKSNFILDLYIELFITEVEYLLKHGLSKKYRKTEGNSTALKGALQFSQHISKNIVHQERFFIKYTTYDHGHLLNQLLYKTLKLLRIINQNSILQSRIGALLLQFPEMVDVNVSDAIFEKIVYNRKTERYKRVIEICRLLLLNYHPDISSGNNHVLALMFDMNLLWERFIYISLKQGLKTSAQILGQNTTYFWKPENGRKSSMRPDIVVKVNDNITVLDTKWKNLKGANPSSDDLRQMYIYHEYFDAKSVALIYPGTENSKFGRYYDKETGELSDKVCSTIHIPVEKNIKKWQQTICNHINQIFEIGATLEI